jgi:hypothetical protein
MPRARSVSVPGVRIHAARRNQPPLKKQNGFNSLKVLVYHGSGWKPLADLPKPVLREATDSVARWFIIGAGSVGLSALLTTHFMPRQTSSKLIWMTTGSVSPNKFGATMVINNRGRLAL